MRNWQDFFYFSSSERRALIFLSFIIIAIGIVLWFTSPVEVEDEKRQELISLQDSSVLSVPKDPELLKAEVLPKKVEKVKTRSFHAPYSSSHRNYTTKYKEKVVVELNSADTTILQKIPGIGSSFSKRIVKYRALLGGFYTVEQLAEVYGIDEERYEKLNPWFRVDSSLVLPLHVNQADFRTLIRHPYLNKQQTVVILNCIKRKGKLSGWNELKLLEEFTEQDIKRLKPYLSFE